MAKTENTANVNEISRLSAGTIFRGEMSSSNDIRIDGTFEGKLYSKGKVVVGEDAFVKGDIICENVDFWGKMEGGFYVKDILTLRSASKINGEIHARKIQIELDASFDGTCEMISEEAFQKIAQSNTLESSKQSE